MKQLQRMLAILAGSAGSQNKKDLEFCQFWAPGCAGALESAVIRRSQGAPQGGEGGGVAVYQSYKHREEVRKAFLSNQTWKWEKLNSAHPAPGSNEYSRVLEYSIFISLLVPYSENFTTRPSSQVVIIFTFFVKIIQISRKWKCDTFVMDSYITPSNRMLQLQQCSSPCIIHELN